MRKAIIFICLFVSQVSFASTINSTKIIEVLAGEAYGDKVFLKVSVKPTNAPSCQTNPNYSFVFNPTTEVGKITFSMILAAYASGKNVYIDGWHNCNTYSGVESIRQIRLQ